MNNLIDFINQLEAPDNKTKYEELREEVLSQFLKKMTVRFAAIRKMMYHAVYRADQEKFDKATEELKELGVSLIFLGNIIIAADKKGRGPVG